MGRTARRLKKDKGNEKDLEEKGEALKEEFEHFAGKICEYGRLLYEGQVTKREKMVENGWKTRSKIYGTGPNKWGEMERDKKL